MRTQAPLLLLFALLAACARADAPKMVLPLDPIAAADNPALVTTDPAEEVGGNPSLKGDSRAAASEWNEFFHSKPGLPGLLDPKKTYILSFDYRVLARAADAKFYVLARRPDSATGTEGWQDWSGEPGQTGHIRAAFTPHETGDILILGIQNKGALAISGLTLTATPAPPQPVPLSLPAPKRTWKSPGGTSYFVDSARGRDSADGRRAAHAWRSLDRVNAGTFGPGDRILLRAGSHWAGFLSPGGSGAAGHPITLIRYGAGPKPAVDAAGKSLATLYLHNGEYWDVSGLDIANRAPVRLPRLAGVQVSLDNFGVAHDIRLRALDIHDVFGSNVKDAGGGAGISCTSGGDKVKTRYDGLLIENCRLARTDRNGITLRAYYPRPAWPLSTRVVIRGNTLSDIGGDGIVPIGCLGCLIEHNTLRGGRMRAQDYAAGIWPWSCDNTVVQFNEVSGMKGTMDGEGYDSDYNCRHTLFQYNYSHDNDGGFMLICDDGSQNPPWNIGNEGTVIRYNVSANDGLHTSNITGPCQNTQVYNNTFYLGGAADIPLVASGNWGGKWPADTRFFNNVLYAAGGARFNLGGMTQVLFDHNAYWGAPANRPSDAHAVTADPRLAAPGSSNVRAYAPRPGSPLLGAGRSIPHNGGRDYWGNLLPAQEPVTIGASQGTASQTDHLRLSGMANADSTADLRQAVLRHDLRFIGIHDFSLSVPGTPGDGFNPLVDLKGINAVEGTSDSPQTGQESRLQDIAERYALRYNRSLLHFLKQSGDADLKAVQRRIDSELLTMERGDPAADARRALLRGDKAMLEVPGAGNGIIGLTADQREASPGGLSVRALALSDAFATASQKPRIRRLLSTYIAPYNRALYRALADERRSLPVPPAGQHWRAYAPLTDEFTGAHLDPAKWQPRHPYWPGRDPSHFDPANVSLAGGALLLRSTPSVQNMAEVQDPLKDTWVHSACVSSLAPTARYGYYEARLKASDLPMTSSFWFQGKYSEIDVVEQIGHSLRNPENGKQMLMNTHSFAQGWDQDIATPRKAPMPTGAAQAYHTYGVWWRDARTVTFFLDGKQVAEATPAGPFAEPMYLFFDTEVFAWEGLPTVESLRDPGRNTMSVDWVRAWVPVKAASEASRARP